MSLSYEWKLLSTKEMLSIQVKTYKILYLQGILHDFIFDDTSQIVVYLKFKTVYNCFKIMFLFVLRILSIDIFILNCWTLKYH